MGDARRTVALGEVASVILSGVDKHILPGEQHIRLCNYLDVYRNRRIRRGMEFAIGSASSAEISRCALRKGDVLITKDSETPDDIGIPAVVEDEIDSLVCGYHLAILRPKPPALNSGFLLHYLQSDSAKRHFLRTANGLTRFGLGYKSIAGLPIALPSLDEQAEIARLLDAIDHATEMTDISIRLAKGLRQSLLDQFFHDALGNTAYADRPRKELPPGWSVLAAGKLMAGEPKNGVSPESSSQPPGTPTFSIAAIRGGRVDLRSQENIKYTRVSEPVAKRYALRSGDILVVRGNANPDLVGRAGIVDTLPDGCIYPDITKRLTFRTSSEGSKVDPEFAVLAWNHAIVHNQILRRAKTSNGTLKINNKDVKQVMLPVPPEGDQSALVRVISAAEAQVRTLTSLNLARRNLKRALMEDLLSGKASLPINSGGN